MVLEWLDRKEVLKLLTICTAVCSLINMENEIAFKSMSIFFNLLDSGMSDNFWRFLLVQQDNINFFLH